MKLCTTKLRIITHSITIKNCDTQHHIILHVIYAECLYYAHYAECRHPKCLNAECCGAKSMNIWTVEACGVNKHEQIIMILKNKIKHKTGTPMERERAG